MQPFKITLFKGRLEGYNVRRSFFISRPNAPPFKQILVGSLVEFNCADPRSNVFITRRVVRRFDYSNYADLLSAHDPSTIWDFIPHYVNAHMVLTLLYPIAEKFGVVVFEFGAVDA